MKATITTPTDRVVVIEMSESEAEALLAVCQHIGGDRIKSRRGHFDNLATALRTVYIKVDTRDIRQGSDIWFDNLT